MTTLKRGSRGAEVKTLQGKLNLMADGIFGPLTEEAVKEFQKRKGLKADGVAGAQTWAALGIAHSKRKIDEIILHCTATPEGEDYTVEQIRQMHLARGFSDIGYHFVIGRDGKTPPVKSFRMTADRYSPERGYRIIGSCPPQSLRSSSMISA